MVKPVFSCISVFISKNTKTYIKNTAHRENFFYGYCKNICVEPVVPKNEPKLNTLTVFLVYRFQWIEKYLWTGYTENEPNLNAFMVYLFKWIEKYLYAEWTG